MATWRIAEDPEAIGRIRAYLDEIDDQVVSLAAAMELKKHFERLVADPHLGAAPTGPFESRPIYRFHLEAGDRRRLAQVAYLVEPDGSIAILAFSCVPM